MPTPKPSNLEHVNASTQRNTVNTSTDQHSNTKNTPLGNRMRCAQFGSGSESSLGSGYSTISTTTPKAGKAAKTVFPAGQTAVSEQQRLA